MIAVRIPKEIRAYKEKLVAGLTARQLICTVIAFIVCVPSYYYGRAIIPEGILSWLVMAAGFLFGGMGYFKYNGMAFERFVAAVIKAELVFPQKRTFNSANCFRAWLADEDAYSKRKTSSTLKKRLSLYRAYLAQTAEQTGASADFSEVNELERATCGCNPKKPNKDKRTKKDDTEKSLQKNDFISKKALKIKKKQERDIYYKPRSYERFILKLWTSRTTRAQLAKIKRETKDTALLNNKMTKRRKLKTSIPRTTQQTLPFIADYEEGLFEVCPGKFSKLYAIKDINYSLAEDGEQMVVFCKYGELLNHFSEDMSIAVTIDNRVVSLHEKETRLLYELKGDAYDRHREEYNKIIRAKIVDGRNNISQYKYITVTIDAETPVEALFKFHKVDAELISNLRKVGSDGAVVSTTERLSILHDKFRRSREGELSIDFDFIKEQGISSKDYIAPSSFNFQKKFFMIEDEYYTCLYVNNLPASMTDDFLAELSDCAFPLITTLSIQPLAQEKALRLVRRQLTGMEANKIMAQKNAFRSGFGAEMLNHDLKQSLTQAEELLDDMINKNQKMFFVTLSLMIHGKDLQELEMNASILFGKARKYACQMQRFDWQQEDAFKSTIPGGLPPARISVDRTLTTESTALFMPFSCQDLFQLSGIYYGINPISRNLIYCDRTSMKTPGGFLLGSSGSGKSFAAKREMLNVLLRDDKTCVFVIDPEGEYRAFAEALGGTVINISPDSANYINPFDMALNYGLDESDDEFTSDETKKEKALKKKSEYLMSIIECLLGTGKTNDSTVTPQQKSVIDRCVRNCYEDYLDSGFDDKYLPTLKDLQYFLDMESQTNEGAKNIAEGLEYYTKGSMDIFSNKSNVKYNNRFVVFNIRELGSQLKHVSLLIVLDFIWNRMITNSGLNVRTYNYVDEIHVLFENEKSALFLKQLYKRGRKFGLVMTGITQNVSDLLKSDIAQGMLSNSDFIQMLSQSPEDLNLLAPMLHISEMQKAYVSRVGAGEGLLFAENIIVPFVDKFPQESYLYNLMSTKFGEKESGASSSR